MQKVRHWNYDLYHHELKNHIREERRRRPFFVRAYATRNEAKAALGPAERGEATSRRPTHK
jgi:hypothetical protein